MNDDDILNIDVWMNLTAEEKTKTLNEYMEKDIEIRDRLHNYFFYEILHRRLEKDPEVMELAEERRQAKINRQNLKEVTD